MIQGIQSIVTKLLNRAKQFVGYQKRKRVIHKNFKCFPLMKDCWTEFLFRLYLSYLESILYFWKYLYKCLYDSHEFNENDYSISSNISMWIIPGFPCRVEREFEDATPVKIGSCLTISRQINGPPKSSWYSPLNGAV